MCEQVCYSGMALIFQLCRSTLGFLRFVVIAQGMCRAKGFS